MGIIGAVDILPEEYSLLIDIHVGRNAARSMARDMNHLEFVFTEFQCLLRAFDSQVDMARGVSYAVGPGSYAAISLYFVGIEFVSYDPNAKFLPESVKRADMVDVGVSYQDGPELLRVEAQLLYIGDELVEAHASA
jgi:hypothetical protein